MMSITGEPLTDSLYYEALDNGRIHVFTLVKMTRVTVDAWVARCLQIMDSCYSQNIPMYVLQDFTAGYASRTPYSDEQGNRLTLAYPDLSGRIAFVVPPLTAEVIRSYIRNHEGQTRERRVFNNRQDALLWLREGT